MADEQAWKEQTERVRDRLREVTGKMMREEGCSTVAVASALTMTLIDFADKFAKSGTSHAVVLEWLDAVFERRLQ